MLLQRVFWEFFVCQSSQAAIANIEAGSRATANGLYAGKTFAPSHSAALDTMASSSPKSFTMTTEAQAVSSIPRLENGDRLTRHEFERRYQAMPHVKKAELIEGVVYMPSPLRARSHGQPHSAIVTWLGVYQAATPGVMVCDNTTVRLDLDNEPQPDALLRIESELGGQSQISEDDYVEGAPELIVEIASSSAAYDLHDKLQVYRRNGVLEYIVWQVTETKLDWFRLQQGEYISVTPNQEGIIYSQVFPGLNLPVESLLAGDLAVVLAEVQRGIATEAHQSFVERLVSRRSLQ